MNDKKDNTKLLISKRMKSLIKKRPFDRITVGELAQRAGIIRPTFYYHFKDKYDVLEWTITNDIAVPAAAEMEKNGAAAALALIFERIGKDKTFYKRAFEIKGQNGFSALMTDVFERYIESVTAGVSPERPMTREMLVRVCAMSITDVIYVWLTDKTERSAQQMTQCCMYMLSHSWNEMLGE